MTVEIKENKEKRVYPWIGYLKGNKEVIVLFTTPDSGVCLKHPFLNNIGKYEEFWNEKDYLPFNGEITLKNS